MLDIKILVRLTRIDDYIHVLFLIFPLIFLISSRNFFSYKTVIIFFANLFLTAFVYTFNDVEDAEDDYHDTEKRKRNPIASGELTKRQGYLLSFIILFAGLFLLTLINSFVFVLGLVFTIIGFFYSWKSFRLKSIPIIDLITHVIFLGVLQFLMTYVAFRPLDLSVTPFLMIIIPYSTMEQIFGELRDFEVDKKTNNNNTIQKFERFDIKKLFIFLCLIVIAGFYLIVSTITHRYTILNLLISILGIVAVYRIYTRGKEALIDLHS